MHNNIRLSRISHPRATLMGFALLIAVFLVFGLWAQVSYPELSHASMFMDSSNGEPANWLQSLIRG